MQWCGMRGRLTRRAGCICAWLLVAGCASHQAYPRHWPVFAQDAQTCNEVSGEYRDEGKTAEGSPASLSGLLFNGPAASTDSVTLSVQQGNRVMVGVELPGRQPLVLSGEDVSCRRGTLVVRAGGKWFVAGGAPGLPLISVGRRSTTLELHAVAQGVVIRVNRRASGVAVVIPYTFSHKNWYRFERLPP